jgi:hypothetical protein
VPFNDKLSRYAEATYEHLVNKKGPSRDSVKGDDHQLVQQVFLRRSTQQGLPWLKSARMRFSDVFRD